MVLITKEFLNKVNLRNIKRAKIKYLESEIELLMKKGVDSKVIHGKQKELVSLRKELKNLN